MKLQFGFFDESNRLRRLSNMGDPLERIAHAVDFKIFRPVLDGVFKREDKAQTGRPPFDSILMFKILLLQQWYGIADDKTEYLINDRLSFQRFLGLTLGSKAPDAKTIWAFREKLVKSGAEKDLFGFFKEQMEKNGIITRSGSLVDASFVEAPKQRNSRSENELIKSGEVPEEWKKSTHKLRQKDTDARWTKKNKENHYGYKNHVKVDKSSKLIVSYTVTDASVHDSQKIVELVDKKDQELYADSAYVGKELHQQIRAKNEDIKLKIHEKGYRNHPLTQEQKNSNREKSRIRARVEHVFGHMTQSMGGLIVRSIGICRARCTVGLQNLAYNLSRYKYLRASGGVKAPAYAAIVTPGFEVVLTQGRGLGIAAIVASQDYAGVMEADKKGAQQMVAKPTKMVYDQLMASSGKDNILWCWLHVNKRDKINPDPPREAHPGEYLITAIARYRENWGTGGLLRQREMLKRWRDRIYSWLLNEHAATVSNFAAKTIGLTPPVTQWISAVGVPINLWLSDVFLDARNFAIAQLLEVSGPAYQASQRIPNIEDSGTGGGGVNKDGTDAAAAGAVDGIPANAWEMLVRLLDMTPEPPDGPVTGLEDPSNKIAAWFEKEMERLEKSTGEESGANKIKHWEDQQVRGRKRVR